MSTTVLEAIENAKCNVETVAGMTVSPIAAGICSIAIEQLSNAIEALENGLNADDVIQENMFSEVKTDSK